MTTPFEVLVVKLTDAQFLVCSTLDESPHYDHTDDPLTIEGDIVITPEQKAALETAIKGGTVADLEAWSTVEEKWGREVPYVISTAVCKCMLHSYSNLAIL